MHRSRCTGVHCAAPVRAARSRKDSQSVSCPSFPPPPRGVLYPLPPGILPPGMPPTTLPTTGTAPPARATPPSWPPACAASPPAYAYAPYHSAASPPAHAASPHAASPPRGLPIGLPMGIPPRRFTMATPHGHTTLAVLSLEVATDGAVAAALVLTLTPTLSLASS